MTYVIGLTGNIGTGKSTVLRFLQELGAYAIDADAITREVMQIGQPAYHEIIAAFGRAILTTGGAINRAALAEQVFADPKALRRLESIVHPPTSQLIERRIQEADNEVIVVEAIKLLESSIARRLCNSVWVVNAPEDVQIDRLVRQRGWTRQEALQRIRSQPPQALKISAADVVIDNSGCISRTKKQVEMAWRNLKTVRSVGGVKTGGAVGGNHPDV